MTKFVMGSAMGFMLGAGMMMMPAGRTIKRDVKRGASMVKRWMRSM